MLPPAGDLGGAGLQDRPFLARPVWSESHPVAFSSAGAGRCLLPVVSCHAASGRGQNLPAMMPASVTRETW